MHAARYQHTSMSNALPTCLDALPACFAALITRKCMGAFPCREAHMTVSSQSLAACMHAVASLLSPVVF